MKTDLLRRRVLASSALLPALALAGCDAGPVKALFGGKKAAAFNGVDLTGANYAHGFSLPDMNGQPRTLADFKGKVVVLFFGYTQ